MKVGQNSWEKGSRKNKEVVATHYRNRNKDDRRNVPFSHEHGEIEGANCQPPVGEKEEEDSTHIVILIIQYFYSGWYSATTR